MLTQNNIQRSRHREVSVFCPDPTLCYDVHFLLFFIFISEADLSLVFKQTHQRSDTGKSWASHTNARRNDGHKGRTSS